MPAESVGELFESAFATSPKLAHDAASDILAVYERDAATRSYLQAILFLKGFQAVQVHRLAHCLWQEGREELALFIRAAILRFSASIFTPLAGWGAASCWITQRELSSGKPP